MKVLLFLLMVSFLICFGGSSNILVICPMVARSHFILGNALAKGLAEVGHHVTLISPFSEGKQPTFPNNGSYREIVLESILEEMKHMSNDTNMFKYVNVLSTFPMVGYVTSKITEMLLTDVQVQEILKSEQTFDAVIVEEFLHQVHKLFASHFKAPLIVFCTFGANFWVNNLVGNPSPPSYVPDVFLNYSTNMAFLERLHNSFFYLVHKLIFELYVLPKNKKMARKYFPDTPALEDLVYNPSIILLNSHPSTNVAVPKMPNMIDIGGFHILPPKELPKGLKRFLDDAPNGAIYFSMGSTLKTCVMHLEKREAILKSLSKLKEKVLLKFEDNSHELPPNIMIRSWFPQSDILAHKNIKLFVTHAGLLSTTETIYHGVPILAIPVYADQHMNAQYIVTNGLGLSLPYHELTAETFTNKLNEVLNNSKYREKVVQRSKIFHDRLFPPMKEAVYWVEYVIRNPDTKHLRAAGVDLPWYKYFLIDVFAFVFIVILVYIYVFNIIIRKVLSKCRSHVGKIKRT